MGRATGPVFPPQKSSRPRGVAIMPSMAELRTKVLAGARAALGTVAGAVGFVAADLTEQLTVLQPLAWYVGKAFHFGFIPLVIVLGMRTAPRPKLVDLLTPM